MVRYETFNRFSYSPLTNFKLGSNSGKHKACNFFLFLPGKLVNTRDASGGAGHTFKGLKTGLVPLRLFSLKRSTSETFPVPFKVLLRIVLELVLLGT